MKPFSAILLLAISVCAGCEVRPTSSQTQTNKTPVAESSPAQAANQDVSDGGPCSLVMDQAPVLNGLRLGMASAEVLALFPGSKEDAAVKASLSQPPDQLGVSAFSLRPDKYQPAEKYPGVSQITFTLLDDRVSRLNVGYNGPQWPHVDKFVEKFVEGTNLPQADGWDPYVGLETMKTLKCKDFEIQIFAGGKGGNLNYVLMSDLLAAKKLKLREDKAAKQAIP
jgi:hypothetical protein